MRRLLTIFGLVGIVAALTVAAMPTQAADHLEAPGVMADGRSDINDMYAFQSPTNPANTVFVMTVNPLAGMVSPEVFDRDTHYEFNVDMNADNRIDERFTVRFGSPDSNGVQSVTVKTPAKIGKGQTGEVIPLAGGGSAWAGLSDDPFFFDLQAFRDQVKGAGGPRTFCDATPTDFFAGLNVTSIVLEVPSASLGGSTISLWGQTRTRGAEVDRMGLPAIATVLIPDGDEDAFNNTTPFKDRQRWSDEVQASLLALSGLDGTPYSEADAATITNIVLPDVLTLDTTSSAGFLNGRKLTDDVIDTELTVVTGGLFGGSPVLTSDCVPANDVPFPGVFPYVAPAHL